MSGARVFILGVCFFLSGISVAESLSDYIAKGRCDVVSRREFNVGLVENLVVQTLDCRIGSTRSTFVQSCSILNQDNFEKCDSENTAVIGRAVDKFTVEVAAGDRCRFTADDRLPVAAAFKNDKGGDEVPVCFGTLICDGWKSRKAEACSPSDVSRDKNGTVTSMKCRGATDCLRHPLPSPKDANLIVSKQRKMIGDPRTENHKRGPNAL